MWTKLLSKVVERKEGMAEIKALLVFPVAAFHFAVVAWCIGTALYTGTDAVPGQ